MPVPLSLPMTMVVSLFLVNLTLMYMSVPVSVPISLADQAVSYTATIGAQMLTISEHIRFISMPIAIQIITLLVCEATPKVSSSNLSK